MSQPKLLLGIGVDEHLQWATARATEGGIQDETIKHHSRPLDDARPLGQQLNELVEHLISAHPEVFSKVSAIGVNTSGIVDTDRHTLSHITRKPSWLSDIPYDFRGLFSPYVKRRRDFDFNHHLSVHNEASGSALAEFAWGIQSEHVPKDTRRLLLIRIDEGVNFGAITLGQPMEDKNLHAGGQSAGGILLPVTRHPEAGHIRPRRHELDLEPLAKKHRGCASHADCFEALASMGRLRKQFGGPTAKKEFSLLDLPDDHKMWTIEANYIAQLCYIGVLVLSPQIIILSGGIGFTDGLLGKIHDEFSALNHAHFIYPEMRTIDEFIKRGLFGPEVTVLGALQLAERASRGDPGRETRIPSSHYDNVIHIAPPKSQ